MQEKNKVRKGEDEFLRDKCHLSSLKSIRHLERGVEITERMDVHCTAMIFIKSSHKISVIPTFRNKKKGQNKPKNQEMRRSGFSVG